MNSNRRTSTFNGITLPLELVTKAAVEAGLIAASRLSQAEREIAMPIRRSLKVIHAEARNAVDVASSLAGHLKTVNR